MTINPMPATRRTSTCAKPNPKPRRNRSPVILNGLVRCELNLARFPGCFFVIVAGPPSQDRSRVEAANDRRHGKLPRDHRRF
jgi:hypothetical protein